MRAWRSFDSSRALRLVLKEKKRDGVRAWGPADDPDTPACVGEKKGKKKRKRNRREGVEGAGIGLAFARRCSTCPPASREKEEKKKERKEEGEKKR